MSRKRFLHDPTPSPFAYTHIPSPTSHTYPPPPPPLLHPQRGISPVITALLYLVGIPLWLVVTIPSVAVALCVRVFYLLAGKRTKMRDDLLVDLPEVEEAGVPARSDRPLDIVVLGATGLTGGALVEYLTRQHPDLKIGLAGRTLKKLEAVRAARGAAGQELIVADIGDLDALVAMCKRTRVVATTVGPFKRYGNRVYHACAHTGTHYADITGEADWVGHMGRAYDDVAKRTGAAIVSCCGVDSVPSDVGTYLACTRFEEEHGSKARRVESVMTRFKGGAPSGTIDTVAGLADGIDRLQRIAGSKSKDAKDAKDAGFRTKIVGLLTPVAASSKFKQWTIPFFMAMTNSNMVRRTNKILGYAPDMQYTERWGFPDASSAFAMFLGFYTFALPYILLHPLRKVVMQLGLLPKPGVGTAAVSIEVAAAGSLSMLIAASGTSAASGEEVTTQLRFSGIGDPGVAHTCVCQAEIARLLALGARNEGEGVRAGAGLTPVAAVGGAPLAEALEKTGLVFIDDVPAALRR